MVKEEIKEIISGSDEAPSTDIMEKDSEELEDVFVPSSIATDILKDIKKLKELTEINTFRSGSKKEQDLYGEIIVTANRLEALISQSGEDGRKTRAIDALKVLIKQLTT